MAAYPIFNETYLCISVLLSQLSFYLLSISFIVFILSFIYPYIAIFHLAVLKSLCQFFSHLFISVPLFFSLYPFFGSVFLSYLYLRFCVLFISVFFHSAVAVVVRGFPSRMNFASQTQHTKFLLSYLRVQNLTPKMNQLGGIGDCN